jgi:hypothetical protein
MKVYKLGLQDTLACYYWYLHGHECSLHSFIVQKSGLIHYYKIKWTVLPGDGVCSGGGIPMEFKTPSSAPT